MLYSWGEDGTIKTEALSKNESSAQRGTGADISNLMEPTVQSVIDFSSLLVLEEQFDLSINAKQHY